MWSVAECIDHLAVADRVYLRSMAEPARRAREQQRMRRKPALPGLIGGWFAKSLEPPVKVLRKLKAPRLIRPHIGPLLADAYRDFTTAHDDVRAFLRANADLDLADITFPNPFIRGVRFSLATGLHVIAAHERRHLWQGWRARQAAESGAKDVRARLTLFSSHRLERADRGRLARRQVRRDERHDEQQHRHAR